MTEKKASPGSSLPGTLTYSVVGVYALFGGLWILLSDRVLAVLVPDPVLYRSFQTYKGWFYVAVTAALLYFLVKLALETMRREQERRLAAETELLQAQKMELVGRLAGGVAHDLNNVLTAIMGLAQISASSLPKDDTRRADMEDILRFAERAGGITGQMLAFSRKQVVRPRPLDPGALVRDAAKMLRRAVGGAVTVEFDLAADLWRVRGDPGQLQQVLMNLAVNGRDAMPRGGKLAVSAANRELKAPLALNGTVVAPGEYVQLSVRDEGVGIAPEVVGRVFEPFFTTKEQGKGTGLGLSVVQGIVRQGGGEVLVESAPGAGSVFMCFLPRCTEEEPETGSTASASAPLGGGETLLLADDQPEVLRVLGRLLESRGYCVLTAGTCAEAVELAASATQRVDLLVTDLALPDGSGPALAEEIRALHPNAGALFISGRADDPGARNEVQEKNLPFLSKPFSPEALLAGIRAALDPGARACR